MPIAMGNNWSTVCREIARKLSGWRGIETISRWLDQAVPRWSPLHHYHLLSSEQLSCHKVTAMAVPMDVVGKSMLLSSSAFSLFHPSTRRKLASSGIEGALNIVRSWSWMVGWLAGWLSGESVLGWSVCSTIDASNHFENPLRLLLFFPNRPRR